ncbi:MAG: FKBP-type peptidyl-prolyl cis-trans isomerase [Bacteroidota bacterium]|nr:FKBP-type peptidyl-prolyl cis-trans isomerase [Bacteroidota bacterium]
MKNFFINAALFFSIVTGVISCGDGREQQPPHKVEFDEAKAKQQLMNVQKPSLVMENDNIESYIKQHQLQMQVTGTGLRYQIIKANPKGKAIISTNIVKVKYKVVLLDGTLCYSSDKNGPKTFKVDFDNVETGIHQGIKLLHEGEKAIFILPSHLAHGLTGDDDMIPPKASVYYEVEVMSVNE